MEFKAFEKIEKYDKVHMVITQKIHGSNAQIVIKEDGEVLCGSRNRWITPEDDNFGFAKFVNDNKADIVEKLGKGTFFGEWAGPGINSGEGLSERTFVLFDYFKFPPDRPLPKGFTVVPILYKGRVDATAVDRIMEQLKTGGSLLVPGFMRVEGIVVTLGNVKYKKVFEAEETKWTGVKREKKDIPEGKDYSYLLQPIRLEKLLSKDERFIIEYPKSISDIMKAYINDLTEESQITADDDIRTIRKQISTPLVKMIDELVSR